MKRILYTILLAIGTLSFSSCTDYINVDKYFYDQVSLDSAFSKRVYVVVECIQCNGLYW